MTFYFSHARKASKLQELFVRLRHKEGSSDVVMQARRYLSCATVASVLVLIASVQGAGAVACGTGLVAANEAFAVDEYDRCHSIAVGSNGVTVHLLWKVSGRETADETVTIAAQFPSDQVSYFVCSMSPIRSIAATEENCFV